jgi:hypothetical protein
MTISEYAQAQGWGVVKSLELIGSGPVVQLQAHKVGINPKSHFDYADRNPAESGVCARPCTSTFLSKADIPQPRGHVG